MKWSRALHQWEKIKRDQSEEERVSGRETSGAIFLERAVVGLAGEGSVLEILPSTPKPREGSSKTGPFREFAVFPAGGPTVAGGEETGCSGG